MRFWRKLHRSIISSDKLAIVSDSAALLYFMLIPVQDDEGRYPWTPTNVRTLTATRDWTFNDANAYCEELSNAGLITQFDGFIEIVRGKELNGQPSHSPKHRHLYPLPEVKNRVVTDKYVTGHDVDNGDVLISQLKNRTEQTKPEQKDGAELALGLPTSLGKWLEKMGQTYPVNSQVGLLMDLARTHWDGPSETLDGGKAATLLKQSNNAFDAVETVWSACMAPAARGDVFQYALGMQKSRRSSNGTYSGNTSSNDRAQTFRRSPGK